jgi:DNA-binding NarL/FixJ family response regulator
MRLVIADDSILLREGLASLLAADGFDIVGQAGDAKGLLELVAKTVPDVALVDIRMPPSYSDEGIRAAGTIDRLHPGVGVLVLSQYIESAYAIRLLEQRTRGRGYLLKDQVADVETLLTAVRSVGEGGSFVDPAVVEQLVGRHREPDALADLTERERELLGLMAAGRSNAAICATLFLSPKTVEGHVRSIFMKLDLPQAGDDHRRVLAVVRYLRSTGETGLG